MRRNAVSDASKRPVTLPVIVGKALVLQLDEFAERTHRNRSQVIRLFLERGLQQTTVTEL